MSRVFLYLYGKDVNMGFWEFLNRGKIANMQYEDDYEYSQLGTIEVPVKLKTDNAFMLANTVSEIHFPIDFIADRASKLRYFIADKNGKEVSGTELNRFVTSVNPLYSFTDLVYQYIFSQQSDGNAICYQGVPSSYLERDTFKGASVNNIDRIDVLQPDLLKLSEELNSGLSILDAKSLSDFIKRGQYFYVSGKYKELDIRRIKISNYGTTKRDSSLVLAQSPLFKVQRNINNLLATYSARYNVYVNNGAAGYLVKKQTGTTPTDVIDPVNRQTILNEINNRHGLTGRRNLWGISSVPLEFINTLITIKDLMPFEETFENAVCIAGNYQIPSDLIPRKDNSTFDNQDTAESSVWENSLMSIVESFCADWTKVTTLDKAGYKVMADFSTVSALKQDDTVKEDLTAKRLSNLKLIKEIAPDKVADVDNIITEIIKDYGKQE